MKDTERSIDRHREMPLTTIAEEAIPSRRGVTSPREKTARKDGNLRQKEEQSPEEDCRKALARPEVLERAFILFLSKYPSFSGSYASAEDFADAEPDVAFIFKQHALTEMRELEHAANPERLAKQYEDRRVKIEAAQRKGRTRFLAEREKQRQKEWDRKLQEQAKVFAARMEEAEGVRRERERVEEARQRVQRNLIKEGDLDWDDNHRELRPADGKKKSLWKRLKDFFRRR